jgi:PAP2 superfamily
MERLAPRLRFVLGFEMRRRDRGRVSLVRFAAIQVVIWAGVYGVYLAVRGFTIGSSQRALANAWDVIGLERAIGIFDEVVFQRALDWAGVFFSGYYMLGFGPLVGIVLVWFGLRDRGAYRGLRNALLLSIALATVVYAFFPTAPPRLVDGLGIEDSVGLSAHDTGSFLGIRFNPYAAVPSMHVGWALLISLYGFRAARFRPLRTFFVVHPLLMAAAVTATGNHFFLDSLAGLAVACLTLVLLRVVGRWRRQAPPEALASAVLARVRPRVRPATIQAERKAA